MTTETVYVLVSILVGILSISGFLIGRYTAIYNKGVEAGEFRIKFGEVQSTLKTSLENQDDIKKQNLVVITGLHELTGRVNTLEATTSEHSKIINELMDKNCLDKKRPGVKKVINQ